MLRPLIIMMALSALRAQDVPTPNSPAEGVYRIGGDVKAPNLVSKIEPEYTEEARKAKISGSVLLSVVVGHDGVPRDIKVARGLGYQLDEAAVRAVSQWRFRPGTREGNPVAVRASIEVSFRLLDNPPNGTVPPISVPDSGVAPTTAEEAYRRADRSMRIHNLDGSILLLAQAVALNPKWPQAFEAKARSEYMAGKSAAAIEDFTRAIQLDGTNPSWFNGRGLVYWSTGMQEKALEDFDRSIELSNGTPIPAHLNSRGRSLQQLGQTDKAFVDFSRAIALSPAFTEAYRNRAEVYTSRQDWPHAIADRSAVIDLDPSAEAYSKRADAKQASGDLTGAEEDRRKSAELRPAASRGGGPVANMLSDTDPSNPDLKSPALLLPADKQEFNVYPRRTVFSWAPVPGAASYTFEWDFQSGRVWSAESKQQRYGYPTSASTFTADFVGAQPGRWRVSAVDSQGRRGPASEWRTFTYLR